MDSVSVGALQGPNSGLGRTLLAFLFVFINLVINLITLSIVHERVPRDIKKPLPDVSFDLLPRWDPALDIAEWIIVVLCMCVFLLLFLHRYRVIIFRRLCVIMGVLYLFRAICMASTQLPIANDRYYCSPQLYNSSDPNQSNISTSEFIGIIFGRVFHLLLGFGLSINGRHNYCGDYLYSGHTVILTLGYLVLREYLMPQRIRTLIWKLFNLLVLGLAIAGVVCILVSRGHYLIDVILAYFVTTRLFWIYHTLAYNHILRVESPSNYLTNVCWWPLFKFFEVSHSKCAPNPLTTNDRCACCGDLCVPIVPRSFEWPLPWPRALRRRSHLSKRLLPVQQA